MGTYSQFEPKGPDEKLKLIFDFSVDLPTGIVLTGSPAITVSVTGGVDASPGSILNGVAGFNAALNQVVVPVQGGLDGCQYPIKVVVQTTDPQIVLALTGTLPVSAAV